MAGGIGGNRIVGVLHFCSFGLLRRLYDWVLSWADSKYGSAALAFTAFAESSFFPVPPDILLIALSVSKPEKSFWYAFVAGFFSVLGGIFGYFIGLFLYDVIGRLIIEGLGYEQYFQVVGQLYRDNAFLAILGAAFTPIPYKVFTIAAGFWDVGLFSLVAASFIGRFSRFFVVGVLIRFFGARVKVFIDRYFNWLTLLFFVLVLLGYLCIKYFI
ncbi:MAG: DedA family protein [Candidatus Altiarchaeota archaeon]|nr:DedA family protein [Candidatus Altiarchaeota archaeon]